MRNPLILLLATLILPIQAKAYWLRPAAYGTVGSYSYHRAALSLDGGWKEKNFDPYVSSELATDNYQRTFTLTAGASKALDSTLRGRAGAGFVTGHVQDTNGGSASAILELGLDKDLGPGTLLGGYSLTAGKVATAAYARDKRGRTTSTLRTQSQTYNAFSGGYRLPLDGFALIFRETVGMASEESALYTTAVTVSVPFGPAKAWNISSTLSADAGASSGAYLGAGLSYLFE